MNEDILSKLKYKPYGLPLMEDAYAGCVRWALDKPEMRLDFLKKSKADPSLLVNSWNMDSMNEKEQETFILFCDWVTRNVWGME